MADHKIELGENEQIRRSVCTPGTRAHLLQDIKAWAENDSSECPAIYWLFGPAGSGKTTVAYTIARQFGRAVGTNRSVILGANFFCSRQFEDTKQSKLIIPTIVYHLARICNPFAEALGQSGTLDAVDHSVDSQIHDLLIEPWDASADARKDDPSIPSRYLVIIDALDEIEGAGGSKFLHELFDVINNTGLRGIRIFATSRPDPSLIAAVGVLESKYLYRLQDVDKEEVSQDIERYLLKELPRFAKSEVIGQLVNLSDGLFIYAATVVRYLAGCGAAAEGRLLKQLPLGSDSDVHKASRLLDGLYHQILLEVFPSLNEDIRTHELAILHTLLCAAEPTSETVVAEMLDSAGDGDLYVGSAKEIVHKLHAVLYTEHGRVLAYHKSFSDFIFDHDRSQEFWCNQGALHRQLTKSCFHVMKAGLKFNIANIQSSFVLDRDNPTLPIEVERHISPVLRYSCQHWSYHLRRTGSTSDNTFSSLLAEFLEIQALFWIEAMNLLKLLALCDSKLRDASKWVQEVGYFSTDGICITDIPSRLTQE